jgi:hypothetical protein
VWFISMRFVWSSLENRCIMMYIFISNVDIHRQSPWV